jgi:hypothetical protein
MSLLPSLTDPLFRDRLLIVLAQRCEASGAEMTA